MVYSTPKKRVLFARSLTLVLLAVFGVFSLLVINLRAPQTAVAAASDTVNFQARLQSHGGAVVPDGSYNIEFKLYDELSGDSSDQGTCSGDAHCLWFEDYTGANVVTVKNGYLSVQLGSVTAFPSTIDWSQQLYLTMNIGGTGTPSWDGEMNPRLPLTATPYSFLSKRAVTADNADQISTTNSNGTNTLSIQGPGSGEPGGTFVLQDQAAGGTFYLLTSDTSGNVDVSGLATAANIETGSVDRSSSGTLSIGATHATSLALGSTSTNIGTTINGTAVVKTTSSNTSGAFQVQDSSSNDLLDVDTDTDTVNIGATGSTALASIVNIATTSTSAQTQTVTIGDSASNGVTTLRSNSITQTITGSSTGHASDVIKGASDSLFQVQDASSNTLFGIDSTNNVITFGDGTDLINNGAALYGMQTLTNFTTGGGNMTDAAHINKYTAFAIPQTTPDISLLIPSPTTNTGDAHILFVSDTGTAPINVAGTTIAAGNFATYMWNQAIGEWSSASASASNTGGFVTLQGSSPGSPDTGNLNISGTGVFGDTLTVGVDNTTTTSGTIVAQQGGVGDTSIQLANTVSGQSMFLGIDHSDSDTFKISSSSANGGTGSSLAGSQTANVSGSDSGNANMLSATLIQAGTSGTVTTLHVHIQTAAAGHMQVGLYADDGTQSHPAALLAHSGEVALSTNNNLYNFTIPSTAVTANTYYWIAFDVDNTGTEYDWAADNGDTLGSYYTSTDAVPYGANLWSDPDASPSFGFASGHSGPFSYGYEVSMDITSGAPDEFTDSLFSLTQTGAAAFQNSSDSSGAFQVQNANSDNLLDVDTDTSTVNIGATGSTDLASVVNIGTTSSTQAQTITIGDSASDGVITLRSNGITQTITGDATNPSDTIKGDSANLFQIQNAGGDSLLTADTTDNCISVGAAADCATDASGSMFDVHSSDAGKDAILGENDTSGSTGVSGISNPGDGTGDGVYGYGDGNGVEGESSDGTGVYGHDGAGGTGVNGQSASGYGVSGFSVTGTAGYFQGGSADTAATLITQGNGSSADLFDAEGSGSNILFSVGATGVVTIGTNGVLVNQGATEQGVEGISDQSVNGSDLTTDTIISAFTSFMLDQTTPGISLNLPAPTLTNSGDTRVIYVSNTGSVAVTVGGVVLIPGSYASFIWNGTTWSPSATGVGSSYIANSISLQSGNFYVQAATSGSVAAKIQGNASGTGDIVDLLDGSSNVVMQTTSTGKVIFQPGTDATDAFQIKTRSGGSGGTPVFNVDTTNGRVGINTSTPGAYALDVNGVINSNTSIDVNGVAVCTVSCTPSGGSGNYIQNGTTVQTTANLFIRGDAGTGITAGTIPVAQIQAPSGQTTGDILDLETWNTTSSTTVAKFNSVGHLTISDSTLTGASGDNVASFSTTSALQTAGSVLAVSDTAQLTTNGSSVTGNLVNVSRSVSTNISGGGTATPTIDNKATFTQSGTHQSTWSSSSITINSGHSNYYIFVALTDGNACDNTHIPTVSVGGTALTLIDGKGNPPLDTIPNECYFLFGHTVSSTGSLGITVTDIDSDDWYNMEVDDWYNVNQSTPYGTEAEAAGGQSITTPNTMSAPTISSSAWTSGHVIVEHNVVNDENCSIVPSTGQTAIYAASGGLCGNSVGMYAAYKTSVGGSQTLSWSGGPTDDSGYWIEMALDLIGASAAGNGSVTGPVASFSDNCTLTAGTCTDSGNVMSLQQQFSGATGAVLSIQNAGSGDMLDLANGSGTVLDSFSANGSLSVGGSLSIKGGTLGGTTVTDQETATGTNGYTESTPALGYYLSTIVGTTNVNTADTFNITGIPTVEGTVVFIGTIAQKGLTSNARTTSVTVTINSTTVGVTTTGSVTAATTVHKDYTVMYLNGSWRAVGLNSAGSDTADFAEYIDYSGDTAPQPGDVLVVGDDGTSVKDSATPYDNHLVGVVSTNPYQVGGTDDGHSVVLALTGRVPVKVSTENGPIEPGDPLTSSSTPGVAMKATNAGQIIGTALEAYDGTQGSDEINVQLHPGYNNPDPGSIQGDANIGGGLYVAGSADIEGDLTVAGTTTTQDLSVSGNANVAVLSVSGGISADSVTVVGAISGATLTVSGNASFGGDITLAGHFITGGTAPTTAVNTATAGSTATCTVAGNDTSGTITLQAQGTGQTAGTQCTLTFSKAFGSAPRTVLSPNDSTSGSMGAYLQSTPTTMTLNFTGVPVAGQTYNYNYFAPQ